MAVPEGHAEGVSSTGIGQRPQNRRQKMVKAIWTGIWLVYLSAPVSDLVHGGHSTGVVVTRLVRPGGLRRWYAALVFTPAAATTSFASSRSGSSAAEAALLSFTLAGVARPVRVRLDRVRRGASAPDGALGHPGRLRRADGDRPDRVGRQGVSGGAAIRPSSAGSP